MRNRGFQKQKSSLFYVCFAAVLWVFKSFVFLQRVFGCVVLCSCSEFLCFCSVFKRWFFLKTAVPHSESKTGTYGINNLLNLRKLLKPLNKSLLKSNKLTTLTMISLLDLLKSYKGLVEKLNKFIKYYMWLNNSYRLIHAYIN